MFGMSVVKTRFDLFGGTITLEPKALFSSSTARIANVLTKQSKSYIEFWVTGKWRNVFFSSLQTSRIFRVVSLTSTHTRLRPHTSLLAMSPAEVTEKLGLHRMRDRSWYVHPRCVFTPIFPFWSLTFGMCSCATTGEGLFEGLQWLSQNVKKRQQ